MWFRREQKNRRLHRFQVLDVKLRSDQVRATRTRLAALTAGILFGTVFGLYLLWRTGEWALDKFVYENSEFAIQHVEVKTDGVIAPDQLRRWSGVKLGDNLIALDLAAVKRNLELVSTIGSVSVERILPRTLKISVTERDPVAQVNVPRADASGGIAVAVFQFDADGYVMLPLDPRLCTDSAGASERPIAGDCRAECVSIAAGSSRRIAAGAGGTGLIGAFGHSPMAGLVDLRRIDVSLPGVVVATTEQGSEITFSLTIWINNCDAGAKFTIWDNDEQGHGVAQSGGFQQRSGSLDGSRCAAVRVAQISQPRTRSEEKCLTLHPSSSVWKSARPKSAPSLANKTPMAR